MTVEYLTTRKQFGVPIGSFQALKHRAANEYVQTELSRSAVYYAAMTLDDAMAIYEGPDDAATRYFERVMTPDLVTRMRPVVDGAMAETGVARAYDSMIGPYESIPLMPDLKGDISDYALKMTLKGLFHKLAAEEAAIRHNPAARSTELLQRVFGAL